MRSRKLQIRHRLTLVVCLSAVTSSLLVTTAVGAPDVAKTQLVGRTTQGWGVTVFANSSRSHVYGFAASVTVNCDGERADRPMLFRGVFPIRRGRFAADVSMGDGRHYKVQGRFTSARRANGTLTYGSTRIVYGGVEVCVTPGSVRWAVGR
jgi:hypothetical protein